MPDPTVEPTDILQKAGLATAAIGVLVWTVRQLGLTLQANSVARIAALEHALTEYKNENKALNETMLKRADASTETIQVISNHFMVAMQDNARALNGLVRALRAKPCLHEADIGGATTQVAAIPSITTKALHDREPPRATPRA